MSPDADTTQQPPDQYGVAGHPVSHSWSPFIHSCFARQTGQRLHYERYDIEPQHFVARAGELFAQGIKGLNITLPHKITALKLAHTLTARAAHAGAVNTLAARPDGSVLGDNTDGAGLLRDLKDNLNVPLAGRRVLLLGAGGAARGALAPLLAEAPATLLIANRTPERAHELGRAFAPLGPVVGVGLSGIPDGVFDVIINTTSAGLTSMGPKGDTVPVPPGAVGPQTACYDMVYGVEATPFCRWAQKQGCRQVFPGWGMLVEQAAEAFYVWRGVRPDTAAVRAAVQERARNSA